ncbi:hypothetical protein ACGFZQ_46680 [Streptomyces sp. NPDC048254]|uniref:hypothetical protein n=1 Tax=Streptomyces sp. NPDC048254 TaxID=3365525 RepID=UPI00371A8574
MFGKRLVVSGAIAILIGTLGACSGGGNGGDDDGIAWEQSDTVSGGDDTTSGGSDTTSGYDSTTSGYDSTPSAQDSTVHGLKDSVRHVPVKTAEATPPHMVGKCSTTTRRVRHTSSSGTGSRRTTRTWYTTERHRSCTKVRSGTETYRRTVRTEKWCVELDDVNGDTARDDVWYQVSSSVYVDARTADEHARLEFVPAGEGC